MNWNPKRFGLLHVLSNLYQKCGIRNWNLQDFYYSGTQEQVWRHTASRTQWGSNSVPLKHPPIFWGSWNKLHKFTIAASSSKGTLRSSGRRWQPWSQSLIRSTLYTLLGQSKAIQSRYFAPCSVLSWYQQWKIKPFEMIWKRNGIS